MARTKARRLRTVALMYVYSLPTTFSWLRTLIRSYVEVLTQGRANGQRRQYTMMAVGGSPSVLHRSKLFGVSEAETLTIKALTIMLCNYIPLQVVIDEIERSLWSSSENKS